MKNARLWLGATCMILLLTFSHCGAQEDGAVVIRQADPCVVSLSSEDNTVGSGFIVNPEGFVLTNRHVVGEDGQPRVRLKNGREFRAEVVGLDTEADLALLKLPVSNMPSVRFGDSSQLRQGDSVLTIGSPMGLDHSATRGIISSERRVFQGRPYLQTDAALNPGNSGGPLLNMQGEVVGVVTMLVHDAEGLGLAMPIEAAIPLLSRSGVAVGMPLESGSSGLRIVSGAGNAPSPLMRRTPLWGYGLGLAAVVAGGAAMYARRRTPRRSSRVNVPPDDMDDVDIVLH